MIRHTRRRPARLVTVVLLLFSLTACAAAAHSPASGNETAAPRHPTPSRSPVPTASPAEIAARAQLSQMTRQDKIASLLMLHVPGTDATVLRTFVDTYHPGGLIFMGDNIAGTPEDTAALAAAASPNPRFPLLVATDQEGGDVRRIQSDQWPSALTLKNLPVTDTEQAFHSRADLLARSGISVNFGIIADETGDPGSFIYRRALGTTPEASAQRVAAAVTGEHGLVLSTLKHFPGHGAAPGDSHTSVPQTAMSLDEWKATDALPFSAGISAGAQIVMFGHLDYSSVDPVPASLSAIWHSILRYDLGFDGITITDDMLMLRNTGLPEYQNVSENAVRALASGTTMLLFVLGASPAVDGVDPAALVTDIGHAVDAGRITPQQIDAAALKLLIARYGTGR